MIDGVFIAQRSGSGCDGQENGGKRGVGSEFIVHPKSHRRRRRSHGEGRHRRGSQRERVSGGRGGGRRRHYDACSRKKAGGRGTLLRGAGGVVSWRRRGLVAITRAADHDWKALKGVWKNWLDERVRLERAKPGGQDCKTLLNDVDSGVVMRGASRRSAEHGLGEAATTAKRIVNALIVSTASVFFAGMPTQPASFDCRH